MFVNNYRREELHIIDIQLVALLITIFTGMTSLFVTYNDKLCVTTGKPFVSPRSSKNIAVINRIVILGLLILFLYLNYETYLIDKAKDNDLVNDKLGLVAATLVLIAGIIVVYVVYNSSPTELSNIENPEI